MLKVFATAKNHTINQENTYPEAKMAKESKGKNGRTNNKKATDACAVSKKVARKTSVSAAMSSNIICTHRTPTQLHASTYIRNSK